MSVQANAGLVRGASVARAVSFLMLLALVLATPLAAAQTACVPQAGGVPGLPGPPDWAVALPPPLTPTAIDDPRWRGAARETFPDALAGTTPDVATRLIHGGGSLYLQFQALGDVTAGTVSNPGSGNVYWDAGYVAFANAAFTTLHVLRIGIDSTGATFVYRWEKTGASWVGIPSAPSWLSANKAWSTQSVSGLSITWTINLKINLASIPGTKFWYGADMAQLPNVAVETYAWPSRGGFTQPSPAPDTSLSAATWGAQFDKIRDPNSDGVFTDSAWGDLNAYTGALPGGCAGIRLEDNAIGTQFDWKIATNASNIFHAQLSAVGTALPAAGAVKARFRIANWGMTIGADGSWNDIPGGTYADNRVNDAAGLIQFTCAYPPACPALPPGSNPDQCMLVEVQAASGPISFLKDSAWRNMLFGTASKFEHRAEISLVGLPQSNVPRDIYLAVKAHNMPAKVDPQAPPPGANDGPDPKQDPYFRYKLAELSPTEQLVVRGQPVYEVRGYRDTGKGTAPTQLVAPMVPYGYVISHTGALVGWQHQLSGVGTVVTTLIPDKLYKISVVPAGKATIQDSIEALEKQPQPPPVPPCTRCCCDFRRSHDGSALFCLLGALGFGLAIRARRGQRKARPRA